MNQPMLIIKMEMSFKLGDDAYVEIAFSDDELLRQEWSQYFDTFGGDSSLIKEIKPTQTLKYIFDHISPEPEQEDIFAKSDKDSLRIFDVQGDFLYWITDNKALKSSMPKMFIAQKFEL